MLQAPNKQDGRYKIEPFGGSDKNAVRLCIVQTYHCYSRASGRSVVEADQESRVYAIGGSIPRFSTVWHRFGIDLFADRLNCQTGSSVGNRIWRQKMWMRFR